MKGIERNGKETIFYSAIRHWWKSKQLNAAGIAASQGGSRDQNLRGDTMHGFRDAIMDSLIAEGVNKEDIFYGAQLSKLAACLPSYYRASKNWDIVVCINSHFKRLLDPTLPEPRLVLAIEFKSQNESIGKNQNNRIEESIGNAYDFWASYENRNFIHLTPRPWLGYLFVGRYADGDENKTVEVNQPHFPTDAAFSGHDSNARLAATKVKGPSYAERYKVFLERMLGKKLYDGACFIVTHESIKDSDANYRVLFPELSGERFVAGIRRHIRAYYLD